MLDAVVDDGEAEAGVVPVHPVNQESFDECRRVAVVGAAVDVARIPGNAGRAGRVLGRDGRGRIEDGVGARGLVDGGIVEAIAAIVGVVQVAEALMGAHLHHVELAVAGPGVVRRPQKPYGGPAAEIDVRDLHPGLDHAVLDRDLRLAHHLARGVGQGIPPLVHDARSALLPGRDAQGRVPRFAGDGSDLDVLFLVELQLAVSPAPVAVAGQHDPVAEVGEVVFPDQVADLGLGHVGDQEHGDDHSTKCFHGPLSSWGRLRLVLAPGFYSLYGRRTRKEYPRAETKAVLPRGEATFGLPGSSGRKRPLRRCANKDGQVVDQYLRAYVVGWQRIRRLFHRLRQFEKEAPDGDDGDGAGAGLDVLAVVAGHDGSGSHA